MRNREELEAEFADLEGCCMHEAQWHPRDVGEIIAWRFESPQGYASTDQVILVRLRGGGFGLLTSSSDTTGHGCRCGADTVRADTLSGLLTHLTEYELVDLLRDREDAV